MAHLGVPRGIRAYRARTGAGARNLKPRAPVSVNRKPETYHNSEAETCNLQPTIPPFGRAGPGQRSIRMERRLVGLVRDVGVSPQRQRALDNASLARRRLQRCPTPRSDGGELLPLCKTATETRRCPTTRARPFRGRMDDCSYSLSRMRRSGTARCPRPLPGPRTCYRTRRAQKNATRTGARARQHDESPYTHGARAKRGPRASHTHYEHTTSATRRPAPEKHTAHTPNSKMRPRAFRIRRARIAARAMAQPSD